jgi:phosphate acetyltransferase
MPGVIERLVAKASQNPKRVALPECDAVKTLQVAREVLDRGVGQPVLVNDPAVIEATAQEAGVSIDGMEIVDITDAEAGEALLARYFNDDLPLSEKGYRRRLSDPIYYAMMLEAVGDVDCTFCGHIATTGDVLIAASNTIGLAEGVDVASIMAIVEVPGFEGPEGDTIIFADCGLNPEPDASELASIAIAAADGAASILGWDPKVAFLSYSTDGSGRGESVTKVREAIEVAKARRPDLKFDGEFQLDTAIVPKVAASKLKRESAVGGAANVLVFPDLDAANIAIKLIQLFAKGQGFGHTLNGFRLPVADSSRSATVEEMLGDIAMVVLAAALNK